MTCLYYKYEYVWHKDLLRPHNQTPTRTMTPANYIITQYNNKTVSIIPFKSVLI